MEPEFPLTTETDSKHRGEGRVITCARCGRPISECEGDCEPVLETRGHRVATAEDLAAAS
ncbi:MAG: hypothetical protein ACRDKV_03540 [Solirubrobacterales bacterium]